MEHVQRDDEMEEREKSQRLRMMRRNSIDEVVEEMEVLIETDFFNEFSKLEHRNY